MIDKYKQLILKNQQPDGGFSYYSNEGSLVESTSYCLMALNAFKEYKKEIDKGVQFLLSLQNPDGGWLLLSEDDISSPFSTALATIVLHNIDSETFSEQLEKGKKYLETVKGFINNNELDEDAWGWNKGGFIAMEPSAYAVLALKMLKSTDKKRIQQGEKFFIENQCKTAGWTYHNPFDRNNPESSKVIYTPLKPQLHITALVLLAMQDNKIDTGCHLKYIMDEYKSSYCPLSLSLATMALNAYQKDTADIINHLNNVMSKDSQAKNVVFYNALALIANNTTKGLNPLCLKT